MKRVVDFLHSVNIEALCVYPLMRLMPSAAHYRVSTMVGEGPLPENEFNSRNTASTQPSLQ